MSEFRPTDAELMQMVDWLASPEAGLKLPAEFLSPVSCAINLVRKQTSTIAELVEQANELNDLARQRRVRIDDLERALSAERQRREEAEEVLRPFTKQQTVSEIVSSCFKAVAYFRKYSIHPQEQTQ